MVIGQSVKVKEEYTVGQKPDKANLDHYFMGILKEINDKNDLAGVQLYGGGYVYCTMRSLELHERRSHIRRKTDTVTI